MIQSLYYKEWLKSRWILLVIFLAFIGIISYSFITISQNIRVGGINPVWDFIVQKGIYYFGYIKYFPLVAGILLAVTQYVPEMSDKRLKLTLHLPLPESKIMYTMLSYGIVCLCIIFLLAYTIIYAGTTYYFPSEIAFWNAIVILPWILGGIVSYSLTTWICIEPVWRQRILNSLISILIISLFYFDCVPEAYNPSIGYLLAITILTIIFSFSSLIRFKDGELF